MTSFKKTDVCVMYSQFGRKFEGKAPLATTRRLWEDNIKVGCEYVYCMGFTTGTEFVN